ncbi:MAG: CHAD domain-containing protein [Gemmatimonadota bacterium]|nr:CHAD domain-containing protein [Gemmatimonadota bacterium]
MATAPAGRLDVAALLPEPTPRAARAVALHLLDRVEAERLRLDDAKDAEALHDFRVAVRRLRSWLRAYRDDLRDSVGRKALERLGDLARATNDSRDIEVHQEWIVAQRKALKPGAREGIAALERSLAQEKRRADAAFRAALATEFASVAARLRKNLSRYAVAVWDQRPGDRWAVTAAVRIHDAFLDLRERLAAVEDVDDDAAAHRARIAAKRLRYLVEPVVGAVDGAGESVELLKRVQDQLGSLHDAHVFARTLRRHAKAGGGKARGKAPSRRGLNALIRRLRARRDEAWDEFSDAWLPTDFARLSELVHGLVLALREIGGAGVEIERKYLLRRIPAEAKAAPAVVIDQGYLPGTALVERVRRARGAEGTAYLRTVKSGTGLARLEIEEPCSAATFKALWPLTKGRRVRKRRHRVSDAGRIWEVDMFLDRRLVLAEIELTSTRDDVPMPEWLAGCVVREVTDEPEYLNMNLAR